MFGLPLRALLAFSLLFGAGQSGLVHRRTAKETSSPIAIFEKESQSDVASAPLIEQIPVTIIHEADQPLTIASSTPTATSAPAAAPVTASPEATEALIKQDSVVSNTEQLAVPAEGLPLQPGSTAPPPPQPLESDPLTEAEPTLLLTEAAAQSETIKVIKALPPSEVSESTAEDSADATAEQNILRQGTPATPAQSTTPQNFVQQLIQNSPIGQFLSQFAGGQQQQQQQGQQQADEAVTPAPTLPGFLNPGAAITSAQQAVQNAAQSVVNTTTQAFQGLQQFATNLGTQFQNTFSGLAGQQNQLSTPDLTTTRPPGPIQSIVSSFVNPANNGSAAAPGQQQPGQQQGPLQGILSFFQGGANRPAAATTAPPKKDPIAPTAAVTPTTVDDKIEPEQDEIVDQELESDTANEVRSSAEVDVTIGDPSSDEAPAEELIVVQDDAIQEVVRA